MPQDIHYSTGWSRTCRPLLTVPDDPATHPPPRLSRHGDGDAVDHPYERQPPSLMRYAEPLVPDELGCGKDESWSLMTLIEEARQGGILGSSKLFPWNRQQIEALWETIAAGWSIGIIVALDASNTEDVAWQKCFGPWRIQSCRSRHICLVAGSEKIAALAWSLYPEPLTSLQQRLSPEETAIWNGHTLVVEPRFRRIRFTRGGSDPRLHLPVWMLPDAGRCARAMTKMEISPIDREWVNRTARRLLEARVCLYLLPWRDRAIAEHMIDNLHQIGAMY